MVSLIRLRDFGYAYGGLSGKSKNDFGQGNAHFITFLGVINNTRLQREKLDLVNVNQNERQNRVLRSDVLFNGSSETPEEVALSAVVEFDPDDNTYLNSFCFGYRLKTGTWLDPTYLAYFFRSPAGRALIGSLAQGSTRYNISKNGFLNLQLCLPPLAEQHRVVENLIHADDLISSLERLIKKKEAIKQGMMQELLTGRTRLPGFTEPWKEVRLGDLAQFLKGSGLAKTELDLSADNACIHYGELFTHYGAEIYEVTNRTKANLPTKSQIQDVLMPTSDVTPRGLAKASAILHGGVLLGGDILVIRPDSTRLHGSFLAYTVRHQARDVLQLVRGSTVFHIYAGDMKNFSFFLPPVDEQRNICEVFRNVELEVSQLNQQLGKAHAIKRGMMQELLTARTRLPVSETMT